jgi:hypothetical protein
MATTNHRTIKTFSVGYINISVFYGKSGAGKAKIPRQHPGSMLPGLENGRGEYMDPTRNTLIQFVKHVV